MKRRGFINKSLTTSIGGMISIPIINNYSKFSSLVNSESTYYFSTSGNLKQDQIVGLGMLEVFDITQVEDRISVLREQHSYHSKLKYSSNDKYKLNFSKAVIDEFVVNQHMNLKVKIILGANSQFTNISPLVRQQKKLAIFQDLLQDKPNVNNIYVTSETPFGPSRDFKESFELSTSAQYHAKNVRKLDLLQVTDFLVGNILTDIKGVEPLNQTKKEILDYFKTKLDISQFTIGINNGKINII